MYLRRHRVDSGPDFSPVPDAGSVPCSTEFEEAVTIPPLVCERGRGWGERGREYERRGEEGEDDSGVAGRGVLEVEDIEDMVWYVLTGSRSTTALGARHLRRRIRERSNSNA